MTKIGTDIPRNFVDGDAMHDATHAGQAIQFAMPCTQCGRPAFYKIEVEGGAHTLCLSCWVTFEDVQFRKWMQSSAMLNFSLDEMDAVVPVGPMGGRIPVAEIARAASRSKTFNNIQITNSTVGVINTGNLAKIDAAITISKGTESEEFGARLKDLTDAILRDTALDNQLRQEMIELVQAISDQVIVSKTPSKAVVSTLFDKLKELASGAGAITDAAQKLKEVWDYFRAMF